MQNKDKAAKLLCRSRQAYSGFFISDDLAYLVKFSSHNGFSGDGLGGVKIPDFKAEIHLQLTRFTIDAHLGANYTDVGLY
ncbi:hypothetical protein MNBD_ALPHA07-1833 [hydrothermal vent metagenome]|uniref:Uncharacterized protein n=1 Tax=hydrothermal vent metagenome TaxID=652676 RepID=A0A3B0SEH3_9ZZZZ